MGEIRGFARADAAAVAALFQKTFRDSTRIAPRALESYFAEAYLDHPWYDPDIASRVYVNPEGRVTGFVGVFPGRFEFHGKPLRAAIPGTLMVEDPEREPLAGAKLLRSVIKGPQDISVSETTNLVSQALWERLGGSVVPLLSLDWFRVFRPGHAALALLEERGHGARVLTPLAWLGERVVRGWTERHLKASAPMKRHSVDSAPADEAFAAASLELVRPIALRPAWSEADIGWLLKQSAKKMRYGSVHRSIVRDGKGAPIGTYLYHGDSGGVGRVLQVLARESEVGTVLDCLFEEAQRIGLAGLRGRATPQVSAALLTRQCIFVHRSSTAIHTENAELASAVAAGDALITGLAGESWTRLVGDEFG